MFRLFGPPGTGKTTQLLNMVDKALSSGVSPHEIAFLAFTRKAATEAKERAAVRFNLDPEDDLFYFRTIHSLTYKLLNLRQKDLMHLWLTIFLLVFRLLANLLFSSEPPCSMRLGIIQLFSTKYNEMMRI